MKPELVKADWPTRLLAWLGRKLTTVAIVRLSRRIERAARRATRRAARRNEPCYCGSGRKLKHCCKGSRP